MRRLRHTVYLSLLGVSLVSLSLVGLAVRWMVQRTSTELDCRGMEAFGRVVAETLPDTGASPPEISRALSRDGEEDIVLALYDESGRLVASPDGGFVRELSHVHQRAGCYSAAGRVRVAVPLPDGRILVMGHLTAFGAAVPRKLLLAQLMMALALALGCWPISRWITRRLDVLRRGVDRIEGGDLTARVPVQGRDEVGRLMQSFNRAAAWIEKMVQSQKTVLASASHELRSPIARLRMTLELVAEMDERGEPRDDEGRARRKMLLADGVRDLEELESMVEDLLLSSRLEALGRPESTEDVDLSDLVTREGRKAGIEVDAGPATIRGNRAMLASLIRNLLENAQRHGGKESVRLSLRETKSGDAIVRVADRGPGVPAEARNAIFQPFYRVQKRLEDKNGVGLGLALVRQIARAHGGSVRCLDREGGGAVFEVRMRGVETVEPT